MSVADLIARDRREDEQSQSQAEELAWHEGIVRRTLTDTDVGDVAMEIGAQLLALIRAKKDPALIGQSLMVGLEAYTTRVAAYRAEQDPEDHPSADDAVRMYLLQQSVKK